MPSTLELPVLFEPFAEPEAGKERPSRLPRIQYGRRHGAVLHPTPLGLPEDVLGLNLSRGCFQRCGFCSARAYPGRSGEETLLLFGDTVEGLTCELASRPRPRAVFLSPSSDPFPPSNQVQRLAATVVRTLARHDVESWIMTRGFIRPFAQDVLAAHRNRVRVTVALTMLDRWLQRKLEPLCAPPRLRLKQIRRLRELDVPVHVALDPLLPGVTDTRENLSALLSGLEEAGVTQVTAGYVFLREGIVENLRESLAGTGMDEVVLDAFRDGPILTAPGLAAARYLPKARRQRGYATLMSLAASHGIQVSVSGTSNPDFAPARRAEPAARSNLLSLYLQAGLKREPA